MGRKYIDYELIRQYPNKYNFTPENIRSVKVLDKEKLKLNTWYNDARKDTGDLYYNIECVGKGLTYPLSEFCIIFDLKNDVVDFSFSCMEGMCRYNFTKFYDINEIEDRWDMEIQIATIKWLNRMVDKGVISKPVNESESEDEDNEL